MNFTKTILNGVREWIYRTFLSYKPQSLSPSEQEQVRVNIGETKDNALELATKIGFIDPITDDEDFILTDENDNILSD